MAQLLKVDGTFADLIPTNGRNFTLTEDIYPLLKTRVVQQIALTDRRVMLMDGKRKAQKEPRSHQPEGNSTAVCGWRNARRLYHW